MRPDQLTSGHEPPHEGPTPPDRADGWSALASALLASVAATVVTLTVRLLFGILSPAEVFGDRLTTRTPLPLFARLLALFGTSAKHWYFAVLVLCGGLLTTGAGLVYARLRTLGWRRLRHRFAYEQAALPYHSYHYRELPVLVGWLWLLSAVILAPTCGGGTGTTLLVWRTRFRNALAGGQMSTEPSYRYPLPFVVL